MGDFQEPYGAVFISGWSSQNSDTSGIDLMTHEHGQLIARGIGSQWAIAFKVSDTEKPPAASGGSDCCLIKSKGANLPQSWRPTLQSQFSQGESMNERMLNP